MVRNGLGVVGYRDFCRKGTGGEGSLSHSLFTHLIPYGELRVQDNGFPSRGIAVAIRFLDRSVEAFTIVFVIHSVDRTLQEMVGGAHPTNVQSRARGRRSIGSKSMVDYLSSG